MLYYIAKFAVSAALIVAISEIAKRNSGFAALIASLPLTSLLAFIWLHVEGNSPQALADLSQQIFWLVLPSLVLFAVFPVLLRHGVNFWLSLAVAAGTTAAAYLAMLPLLRRFGVQL